MHLSEHSPLQSWSSFASHSSREISQSQVWSGA